ncbi:hypothetical protein [Streptomyces sp. NPDC002067]
MGKDKEAEKDKQKEEEANSKSQQMRPDSDYSTWDAKSIRKVFTGQARPYSQDRIDSWTKPDPQTFYLAADAVTAMSDAMGRTRSLLSELNKHVNRGEYWSGAAADSFSGLLTQADTVLGEHSSALERHVSAINSSGDALDVHGQEVMNLWHTACESVHTWWDGLGDPGREAWKRKYKIPPVEQKGGVWYFHLTDIPSVNGPMEQRMREELTKLAAAYRTQKANMPAPGAVQFAGGGSGAGSSPANLKMPNMPSTLKTATGPDGVKASSLPSMPGMPDRTDSGTTGTDAPSDTAMPGTPEFPSAGSGDGTGSVPDMSTMSASGTPDLSATPDLPATPEFPSGAGGLDTSAMPGADGYAPGAPDAAAAGDGGALPAMPVMPTMPTRPGASAGGAGSPRAPLFRPGTGPSGNRSALGRPTLPAPPKFPGITSGLPGGRIGDGGIGPSPKSVPKPTPLGKEFGDLLRNDPAVKGLTATAGAGRAAAAEAQAARTAAAESALAGRTAGAAARGGMGGMPFMPPMTGAQGAQRGGESERERTTWLLEDEDTWGADTGGDTDGVIGRPQR